MDPDATFYLTDEEGEEYEFPAYPIGTEFAEMPTLYTYTTDGSGLLRWQPIARTNSPHLAGFLAEKTNIGATAYTDESKAYSALGPWCRHEAVNHSANEYARGQAHTNGMESFWSMLKRGTVGTFHHLSLQHLEHDVGEFSGRHNVRNRKTIDQMSALAPGMVGERQVYGGLIA